MTTHSACLTTTALATLSLVLAVGLVGAHAPAAYTGDISPVFGSVTDTCAFEFSLWDATADGSRIGSVIQHELRVRGGLYDVELDFGPKAFENGSRYLEVAVGCPAGTAGLTTLTRKAFFAEKASRSAQAPPPQRAGAPLKAALGTRFTYQGELKELGTPVTGTADFQFSLWDAHSGGVQIGATVPANVVSVDNGRFTVQLDFGAAAFDGDARWLEIAVDYPSGGGSFSTLTPRQPLSAAPYALQTRGIFVDDIGEVGVGTTNPSAPLHVWADGSRTLRVRNAATSGGTAVVAEATGGTGWATAIDAYTASPGGVGVFSFNEADSGNAYAIQAETASQDGIAISGRASNSGDYSAGIGVYGRSDGDYDGTGVYGETTNTGTTYGVRGVAAHGVGVRGQNDDTNNYGLLGSADEGVYGRGYGASAGVHGIAAGSGPAGQFVINDAANTEAAVKASTPNANGFAGHFSGGRNFFDGAVGIGIDSPAAKLHIGHIGQWHWTLGTGWGDFSINNGGHGFSIGIHPDDALTYMWTTGADGRLRIGNPTDGVILAIEDASLGIGLISPTEMLDVMGSAKIRGNLEVYDNVGIGTDPSVYSLDVDDKVFIEEVDGAGAGWLRTVGANDLANVQLTYLEGYPNHGFVSAKDSWGFTKAGIHVDASGQGIVTGDVKSFRVPYPDRPESDIWYASLEGPEAAMYIRGTGHLVGGRATITLPDHFRKLALETSMTVQLTPGSLASQGLAVGVLSLDGIEVGELHAGNGSYDFHWVVTAVRRAHQDFEVIRPWTEALPGGHLEQNAHWTARLRSIEKREQRLMEIEAGAPAIPK